MDDLFTGELDFLDYTLVSHEIQTNGPRYNLLPKIILGAVDKSFDYSKKLQLYGDELCKIPSEEDMKKFFKFAKESVMVCQYWGRCDSLDSDIDIV